MEIAPQTKLVSHVWGMLLPLPPECYNYICVPSHSALICDIVMYKTLWVYEWCMWEGVQGAMAYVYRAKDNPEELVPSFHLYLGPRDRTQVTRVA